MHIRHNSAGAKNGVLEGWIDNAQVLNYQNVQVWDVSATIGGMFMAGTWNCIRPPGGCQQPGDQHPDMDRWSTNFVASTQRIGCLGGSAVAPAAPTRTLLQ